MNKPPFSLKFQFSEAAFERAHRVHLRRSLLTFPNLILVSFALAIGAAQGQVFGKASAAMAIFIGLWVFVIGLMVYAYWALPGRLYRRNPAYARDQEVVLGDSGVQWTTGGARQNLGWDSFSHVYENAEFLFLGLHKRVPIAIPKQAFDSEDSVENAREYAARMMAESK